MKTNYRRVFSGLVFLAAAGLFGATDPATKPAKATATHPATAKSIPADQIVAAAATLAKTALISEATARGAAQSLLSQNFGVFTNADVDKLTITLLQQANKAAAAEVQAQQAVIRQAAAKKKAQREAAAKPKPAPAPLPNDGNATATPTSGIPSATDLIDHPSDPKDQKDSTGDLSQQDQAKLQLLEDRKAKLAQLLSDIQKRVADTSNPLLKNQK